MQGKKKLWEGKLLHHFTLRSSSSVDSALDDDALLFESIATKMVSGFPIILMDTFILLGNWLLLHWHFSGISQGFNLNLM